MSGRRVLAVGKLGPKRSVITVVATELGQVRQLSRDTRRIALAAQFAGHRVRLWAASSDPCVFALEIDR